MKYAFRIAILIPFLVYSCASDNETTDADDVSMQLLWSFDHVDENYENSRATFRIRNSSESSLDGTDWALYFSQKYPPGSIADSTLPFAVETITGEYRKIYPVEGFDAIGLGQSIDIPVNYYGYAGRVSHVPKGAYIAWDSGEILTLDIEYDFPANEQEPVLSNLKTESKWRYDENRGVDTAQRRSFAMVPTPQQLNVRQDPVEINGAVEIGCPKEFLNEAQLLAKDLELVFRGDVTVNEGSSSGNIVFRSGDTGSAEGYRIRTDGGSIEITAKDAAGAFYATRTLLRMVAVDNFESPSDKLNITAVDIDDFPRFDYRGLHLDVSRNFHSLERVKRIIDQISYYKLNKLMITLTNDEGWRIEIPGLPELTDIGAKRGHTVDESDMLYPAYGSGPIPKEGQFYTRAEFIELLRYADQRHVDIIPEIDLPGHARAAIKAMQARAGKLSGSAAEEYLLHDPADTSKYSSAQDYSDNVVCVCRESTYTFVEKVISEIVEMYKEAGVEVTLIHSGGDEIPYGAWQGSPMCDAWIAEHDDLTSADQLHQYFLKRFIEILKPYGIYVGGWEEIVLQLDEAGHNTTNINFNLVGQPIRPYVWNSVWGWGREDMAYKLANAGYKIVMCNSGSLYFDLAYENHPSEPGLTWSGYVNTRTAFEFAPFDMFATATRDRNGNPLEESYIKGKTRLKPDAKENILGIQGQLWSETIDNSEMLDYYLFPKVLGLAERAWYGEPDWPNNASKPERLNEMDSQWSEFASAVGWHELPRLDHMFGGTAYRVPLAGASLEDGVLQTNVPYPNFVVRYTTDGSMPDGESPRLDGSARIENKGDVQVRVFTQNGRMGAAVVPGVD